MISIKIMVDAINAQNPMLGRLAGWWIKLVSTYVGDQYWVKRFAK
jgi:hypothetical protein